MESLSDTEWDVVISGTGLQQSLLALALSRSGKNILHVDANGYYGGLEAALTLKEADEWAESHKSDGGVFSAARVTKAEGASLAGLHTLALAPQLIHTRSELLSQLVSSKAFRQVEFLAVGSFFIYEPATETAVSALARVPSTREDVFSNTTIPVKSKRFLMKFLKFVLEFDSDSQTETWNPHAQDSLSSFLATEFKLDTNLQAYIVALTLSLDGNISVEAGLTAIHRHLTSMGVFGAGFAAVYPKWGGLSEVAQVGCRASAVGGAVYMLGVGVQNVEVGKSADDAKLDISLTNDLTVRSKTLVQGFDGNQVASRRLSRLIAVVDSSLTSLFQTAVEGAPTPSVAVVALPAGSVSVGGENQSKFPIYVLVHSSDTGECSTGQCSLYLSTIATDDDSSALLDQALSSLLSATTSPDQAPIKVLYQLYYEQAEALSTSLVVEGNTATFPHPSLGLAFSDSVLDPVREAWDFVMERANIEKGREEYMVFEDREGFFDEDDAFDE